MDWKKTESSIKKQCVGCTSEYTQSSGAAIHRLPGVEFPCLFWRLSDHLQFCYPVPPTHQVEALPKLEEGV